MAISPFFNLVDTDRALEETRTVTVAGSDDLPAGEYAFMEFYCDDPRCDCRRVIFQVWRRDSGGKIWATITYGWDTPEYYATWSHCGPGAEAREMASATLEPISPQTEFSDALLDIFKDVLLRDEAYVERLQRHYHQVCPQRKSLAPPLPRVSRDLKLLSPANRRRLRELKRRRH